MKAVAILSVMLILIIFSAQAFGQTQNSKGTPLNHPGLKQDWNFKTDGYNFTVDTVSNYNIKNVTFNKEDKKLILTNNSLHTRNLAEIQIPSGFINGNFTVFQNEKQISPLILKDSRMSLVVLKFNDTGDSTTVIVGTTYLPEFADIAPLVMIISFMIVFLIPKVRKF